jgi:hypothetical protein
MKKNIVHLLLVITALMWMGCQDDYLTEDGIHDPKINKTTYDFLQSHPWQYFDTLVMLIDHHNMQDEVNAAGTLVAVTDYSFRRYFRPNWTLDSLFKNVKADTLRSYLYDQRILWEDLNPSVPQAFNSKSGKSLLFRMVEQTDPYYSEWTQEPVYLLYIGINKDDAPTNPVQSSNIQTKTGVVHAMSNVHIFNYGR